MERIVKRGNRANELATAVACVAFTAASGAFAASGTWLASPEDSNWSNSNNWSSGTIAGVSGMGAVANDSANFNASSRLAVTPDATRSVGHVNFNSNAGSYTIGTSGGPTLYLAGGGSATMTNNSSATTNTITVAGPVALLANYQFSNIASSANNTIVLSGTFTNGRSTASTSDLQLKGTNLGANTLSGIVSDGSATAKVALTKLNLGTWIVSNSNNSYTGATAVSAGTLILAGDALSGVDGVLGKTSQVTVGSNVSGVSNNAALLVGYGSTGYTMGRATTVASLFSGSTHTVTLGGANTAGTSNFTGNITLNRDVILQAASGGTVEFKTGTWNTNNKAMTVGTSGNTGTVKLSNTFTSTAAASVSYGTLVVNGNLAGGSTLSVANGATLAGKGSISKALTIYDGATLTPGDGDLNTLTVSSSVTLQGGSKFVFDLGTTDADGNDKVNMAAQSLNLNGQQITDFTFNHSGKWTGGEYVLFDAGTLSGELGQNLTMSPEAGVTLTLKTDLTNNNNDLVLAVSIPEPATLGFAVGVTSLGLLGRKRRRAL